MTFALVLASLVLGPGPTSDAHPIAVRSITLTRTGGFVAHNDRVTITRRRPAQLRRIAALLPAKLPSKHTLPVCPDCLVETLTVVRGRTVVYGSNCVGDDPKRDFGRRFSAREDKHY